jgi:hypothetical protein
VCFLSRDVTTFTVYLTQNQLIQDKAPVLYAARSIHCEKTGMYSGSEEGGVAAVIIAVSPYITKTLHLTFLITRE